MDFAKSPYLLILIFVLPITVLAKPEQIHLLYDQFQGDLKETPGQNDSSDIVLRKAFSLDNLGENDKASNAYGEFFRNGQDSAFARYSYALLNQKQGNLNESINQIEKAIQLQPRDSKLVVYKIDLLRKLKKDNQALHFATKKYKNFGVIIPGIEFHLAELLFHKKNYKQAIFHYRQVLYSLKGGSIQTNVYRNVALWRMSHILIELKNQNAARKYLEEYIQHNPSSYYARYILAEYIYLADARFDESLELFKQIDKLSPTDFNSSRISEKKFLNMYALSCYASRDLCFLDILQRIAKNTRLNSFQLAMKREWFKKDRQAVILLLPLIKKRPRSLHIRLALLNVLKRSSRQDLYLNSLFHTVAIAWQQKKSGFFKYYHDQVTRFLKNNPEINSYNFEYFQNESRYYFSRQEYHRAALSLANALKLIENKKTDPKYNELRLRRAFYLGQSNNNNIFLEGLYNAKELSQCNTCNIQNDAQSITGILYMDQHDWDNAISLLEKAYKKSRRINNYFWAGASYYESGQIKKAVDIFEEILLSKNKTRHHSENFLAYHLAKQKTQLKRALNLSKQSLVDNPMDFNRHDTLGYVYYRKKQYNQALYHFQTSLALLDTNNKSNPEVLVHLADTYQSTGNEKMARAWYKRAKHTLHLKINSLTKRKADQKEVRLLRRLNEMNL